MILFGLTEAPATFEQAMDIILFYVKWQSALVCSDDIVVFSTAVDKHVNHYPHVLSVLQDAGVTGKLEEFSFSTETSINFDHVIRPGRLEVVEETTEAIR